MRLWWGVLVLVLVLVACGDSSPAMVDAMVDAKPDSGISNPPLQCPTSNPNQCTEALPSLVGTWKFAPSTTPTITFVADVDPAQIVGTTSGATVQMMHLFDGTWHVEATAAWTCTRNGNATTISSICKQASTGDIRISGTTRVPGFHTAYETTEFFSGTLVP